MDAQTQEVVMVGIVVDYMKDGFEYRDMRYYNEARANRVIATYLEEGVVRAPAFMHQHYTGKESDNTIKPTKLVVMKVERTYTPNED